MKTAFIGCGNMAGAILEPCLQKNFLEPADILICEKNPERLSYITKKYGVMGTANPLDATGFAKAMLIGVKPQDLPPLLPAIGAEAAGKDILFISIAAGQTLARLESMLGINAAIVRAMPNLNARVGEGVAALCANMNVTESGKQFAMGMFRASGEVFEIPEKHFSAYTAIAGCSPAFTFMYIDALARAAARLGMNKRLAGEIAAMAVLGGAKTLLKSGEHPWEMIDRVCSPGGATIEGVSALQSLGFEAAIAAAVSASAEKDVKLSEQQ